MIYEVNGPNFMVYLGIAHLMAVLRVHDILV
jgi:hypothetical protein